MKGMEYYGISLGSSNVVICERERGVVLREASALVCETYTDRVLAVGNRAAQMIGRMPETMTAVVPVHNGVVSDYHQTVYLLRTFLKRVRRSFLPPVCVITVPACATVVERKAVGDAVRAASGGKVVVMDNAVGAALGCGIDVLKTTGEIVMDIGGGKTEISVIFAGQVLDTVSSEICGDTFDDDIVAYVRKNYNILIGKSTAEEVKKRLGNVADSIKMDFMTLSGRDLLQGLPVSFVLSSEDVRNAMADSVSRILDSLMILLERLKPELTESVQSKPIRLCGGCSQMAGWQEKIMAQTGLMASVVRDPCDCVARGAASGLATLKKIMKMN